MNSNGQHPNDDIIERELVALREPAPSEHSIGNAVLAMRATPSKRRVSLKWPIGIGAAAAAGVLTVLVLSASPRQAYAGELSQIAANLENQPRTYQKSFMFFGEKKPMRVHETWTHGPKQAFREFGPKGELIVAITADRNVRYHYSPGSEGMRPWASKDHDNSGHFPIDSIDRLLESEFFKKNQTEKKTGVMLNGKACDYYSFAKGYYRVWIDPETKLPLQREIYDKGVKLWERDVYEYPKEFASDTFEPYKPTLAPYFDYPDARSRLEAEILAAGQSQKVGSVTITLKAVVMDPSSLTPIWTTSGASVTEKDKSNVQIDGVQPWYTKPTELSALNAVSGLELQRERVFFRTAKGPVTFKVAAWNKNREFVGWATFQVSQPFSCPETGTVLVRPDNTVSKAVAAVKKD